MGRRLLGWLTLLAALGHVACPRPTDGEPQIPISPGVEQRLCRFAGHGCPLASDGALAEVDGSLAEADDDESDAEGADGDGNSLARDVLRR